MFNNTTMKQQIRSYRTRVKAGKMHIALVSAIATIMMLQSCGQENLHTVTIPDSVQVLQNSLEAIESVSIGQNREILINGKPFFPIMSWAQPKKNYPLLKSIGINTYVGNADPVAAKELGRYAVPGYKPDAVENGYVMAWIFDDEPDMPVGTGGDIAPRQSNERVAEKSAAIKAATPERLLFMTFTGHFYEKQSKYTREVRETIYPAYVRTTDVVGFDIYPIYGSGYASRLDWVGGATERLVELAPGKPVYAWIETSKGSKWMTYEKQPDVLPMHTRNEVWQAIIHGATAIGYFTHAWAPSFTEFAPTAEMQKELLRLNAQVSRLGPAILAAPTKARITMSMADGLNCRFKATDFNGDLYIFSLNMDLGEGAKTAKQFDPIYPRGGKATFAVEGLKSGTKIEVVDENRFIKAENGKFTDDFAPLAEHIYRIKRK
jgi:hypothetical protein